MKCPRCRHKVVTPAFERSNLWRCAFCGANGCVDHGAHRLVLCCICFDVQLCPECADTIERAGGAAFICRPCKVNEAEEALTRKEFRLPKTAPIPSIIGPDQPGLVKITLSEDAIAVSKGGQRITCKAGDSLEWNGKTWRKL